MAALAPSGLIHSCSFVYLRDRKSTRLNSSHLGISYAVFCLKKNIVRSGPVFEPRVAKHCARGVLFGNAEAVRLARETTTHRFPHAVVPRMHKLCRDARLTRD